MFVRGDAFNPVRNQIFHTGFFFLSASIQSYIFNLCLSTVASLKVKYTQSSGSYNIHSIDSIFFPWKTLSYPKCYNNISTSMGKHWYFKALLNIINTNHLDNRLAYRQNVVHFDSNQLTVNSIYICCHFQ